MDESPKPDVEQLTLYLMIAAIGMIPVIVVLARGGVFGSEATIGLLMLASATAGLLAMFRVARKRRVH